MEDGRDHKKEYDDVDATLCWGPMIFGMMLGGAMNRGRGGPVMMRPGMGPYSNTMVPGTRMPRMMGPGMGQGFRGTGIGGAGMVGMGMRQPGVVRRYPMY